MSTLTEMDFYRSVNNEAAMSKAPLMELDKNFQLTLPPKIVAQFKWRVGDQFSLAQKNGMLCLTPYPQA